MTGEAAIAGAHAVGAAGVASINVDADLSAGITVDLKEANLEHDLLRRRYRHQVDNGAFQTEGHRRAAGVGAGTYYTGTPTTPGPVATGDPPGGYFPAILAPRGGELDRSLGRQRVAGHATQYDLTVVVADINSVVAGGRANFGL